MVSLPAPVAVVGPGEARGAVTDEKLGGVASDDGVVAGAAHVPYRADVVAGGEEPAVRSQVQDVVTATSTRVASLAVAVHDFQSRAALEDVVARADDIAGFADRVRVTDEALVAVAADEEVVSTPGRRAVLGVAVPGDAVVPITAVDLVVATAEGVSVRGEAVPGDDVVPVAAEEPIVASADGVARLRIGSRCLRSPSRDTTLDGSRIREVARMQYQTLAEAVVPPSGKTFAYFHTFE